MRCALLLIAVLLAGCADDDAKGKRVNEPCANNTDCADRICHAGVCAASAGSALVNGQPCQGAGECRSFRCVGGLCEAGDGPPGASCLYAEECQWSQCTGGTCAGPSPVDAGLDATADAPPADIGADAPADLPQDAGPADLPQDAAPVDLPQDAALADALPATVWITVPSGSFTMGSPPGENCRFPEEEQHPVTLTRSFELMATEVTQAEYAAAGWPPSPGGCPSCPAIGSWHVAVAFCNKLSLEAGLTPCYEQLGSKKPCTSQVDCDVVSNEPCLPPFVGGVGTCGTYDAVAAFDGTTQTIYDCPGYRLPTEAEWEYAYRAGAQTALYSGAELTFCSTDAEADKIGWYPGNATTWQPVGTKPPNALGLYDMAGNALEWVHDHPAAYGTAAAIDPWGSIPVPPSTNTDRGSRGGGMGHPAGSMRAAARGQHVATHVSDNATRCARTLP